MRSRRSARSVGFAQDSPRRSQDGLRPERLAGGAVEEVELQADACAVEEVSALQREPSGAACVVAGFRGSVWGSFIVLPSEQCSQRAWTR
jgi:hypothetical protein